VAAPSAAVAARGAAGVHFDWTVDGIPDQEGDDQEEVDYELDTAWDEEDVGL